MDHAVFAEGIRALNRPGNNLNQIARTLNRGNTITAEELQAALRLRAATGAANDH